MKPLAIAALGAALAFAGGAWAQDLNPPAPAISRTNANQALQHQGEFNQFSNDPSSVNRLELDRALSYLQQQANTRFDAIEKAIELAHEDATRVPTIVDRAVIAVQALLEGKIGIATESINSKLEENSGKLAKLDIQFQERTAASSTAIAAALQAAKEAVNQQTQSAAAAIDKAQLQTTEQLTQLRTLFSSEIAAASSQINDLKSRLDKSEGPLLQSQANVAGFQAQLIDIKSRLDRAEGHVNGAGDTYIWIFAAIGAGGVIVGIIAVLRNHPPRRAA